MNSPMLQQHKKAKRIVEEILRELDDRGGFDGWWGDIDEDIQEEIKAKLTEIVYDNL